MSVMDTIEGQRAEVALLLDRMLTLTGETVTTLEAMRRVAPTDLFEVAAAAEVLERQVRKVRGLTAERLDALGRKNG